MPDISSAQLLGLGGAVGNWYMRLATYASEQAGLATSRVDAGARARGNAAALTELAGRLHAFRFNADDPYAILGTHVFHLTGRTDPAEPYVPSETARLVLGRVGQEMNIPWTDTLLAILAAEVKDFAKTVNRMRGEVAAAKQDADEARSARNAAEQKLSTERGARVAGESEVARLRAVADQLEAENQYLRSALEQGEPTEPSEASVLAPDSEDFPTPEQLEGVFDQRRIKIAEGLFIERHEGDTWFVARVGNAFHWLGSATDGQMTITDAAEARERVAAAAKEKV